MKRFLCVLGVAGLSAVMATAQMRGGFGGTQQDPARMVEARVTMLAQALNLTADQKAQATKLFTDAQEASQRFREEIQVARQELQTAIKANDLAAIERNAREIGTATGEMTVIEARAQAAFYLLLTAEQRSKYDQMPGRGLGMGPGNMRPPGRMRPEP